MRYEGIRGRPGAQAVGTKYPHIHRLAHPLPGPHPHHRCLIISTRRVVDNERDALYNIPSTVQPIGSTAFGLRDALSPIRHLNPIPFAVRSGTALGADGTYVLTGYAIHPYYDGSIGSPDVATVRVDGELSVLLYPLPRGHATGLEVGQPVGTVGFPVEVEELLPYKRVHIATFKDGTISALRPFSASDPDTSSGNTPLVQHNLDLSPGTSGSPIIDYRGWMVAINNAGTVSIGFDIRTGRPKRVPTGNIGFGIRVDEVWTMVDWLDASASAATHRIAPSKRAYPGVYRAFPEGWDR